ncbi:UNVERIFIED_CONTAM: hypothetical protein ABID98_004394 [Brevibacillus sp. OAP136]
MNEMVFETIEGYRIIGVSIEPTATLVEQVFGAQKVFAKDAFNGVFIRRTRLNKITFLPHDVIKRIRPVTIFDTEYDPPLGIGK